MQGSIRYQVTQADVKYYQSLVVFAFSIGDLGNLSLCIHQILELFKTAPQLPLDEPQKNLPLFFMCYVQPIVLVDFLKGPGGQPKPVSGTQRF